MSTPQTFATNSPPFHDRKYLIKRRLLVILGSKLNLYDSSGAMVAMVHQKAFKLREDIRVYTDDSMSNELLTIKARQILDFKAAYDVIDPRGNEKVGVLRRKGWSSIVRDNWEVLDRNDAPIGEIIEDHMILALLRRFATNLIPQNYDLNVGGKKAVDFRQRFNPFAYNLDIELDAGPDVIDPRLALASAILLATIEGRQSGG